MKITMQEIRDALSNSGYCSNSRIDMALWASAVTEKPLIIEGDPGVGKTSAAKALAKGLDMPFIRVQMYDGLTDDKILYDYDYQKQLLTLESIKTKLDEEYSDMSLQQAIEAASNSLDFYGEQFLIKRPVLRSITSGKRCVILFDEIEKAHPEVFNTMLQIFDEGHLTDGSGRKVDFRNTIIIMTSNVGSRDVVKKSVQVGYSTVSKSATASATPRCEYRKALEQTFAPEFLNRIDDIVLFRTLELSDVERIIELELQGLFERTRRLGYKVKITDGAKRRLAAMGYESRYGVRSLKRTLMDNVEEPLSTLIIDGKLHEGDTVVVESDKSHGVKLRVA